METRTLMVEFLAPAFPGDAWQNGTWRTPPFKAQLRQWWRVVQASRGLKLPSIRETEGRLFGDATGERGNRSHVRLRLQGRRAWTRGSLGEWVGKDSQRKMRSGAGQQLLAADLYLGYGPVQNKGRSGTGLKADSAVDAGENAEMRLAWPADQQGADAMDETLALMDRLGTLGGRSRNGWGSYTLSPSTSVDLQRYEINWRDAIDEEWMRGIGRDEAGLLIWQTGREESWEPVIRRLAEMRKQLCMDAGGLRTLLSFPVTKRDQPGWTNSSRVPNTLRFKVIRDAEGLLRGQVAHLPCRPSDELWNALSPQDKRGFPGLWEGAHELLDEQLERVTS